jgi:murein L,D-transpeptidase YafK|tara:strand:- start:755 stop:1915 length:1161 start_codon:yes stop_codon:yes gene_type:complete
MRLLLILPIIFYTHLLKAENENPFDEAESRLLEIIDFQRNGAIDEALQRAEILLEEYPNFKLGKFVYSELLTAKAQSKNFINKVDQSNEKLALLKKEASARLNFKSEYKNNNLIPKSIINISKKSDYLLIVELSKSRLYLVKNDNPPRVVNDFYVSIGKEGYSKFASGDNKTPTGIYTVKTFLHDNDLPELYGNGAFPINYPNSWDKRNNKTGYGIWIHGVPRDTYSRPPLASEGCVVTSNKTLLKLKEFIHLGETKIILTEEINWVTKKEWKENNAFFQNVIQNWKMSWESLDPYKYIAQHSVDFKSKQHDFEKRVSHILRITKDKEFIDLKLRDINIFFYPNKKDLVFYEFKQDYKSNNFSSTTRKGLFWKKEEDVWRIIHEGS